MGDFMDQFREEVERQADARWLTSPLAEWMEKHNAEAAELLNHRNLDWANAARLFSAQGLQDHRRQPPTAETMRETWQRVEARRRAGLELRKGKR